MKTLYIKAPPSVSQHFWHFMMGEFLPITYIVFKHKYTHVHLVKAKCKVVFPLNSFYDEVCRSAGVHINISSTPLKGHAYITPLNWDWYNHNEQHKLLWIARYLKRWAVCKTPPPSSSLCIVQDRENSAKLDAYYNDTETLPYRKTYGAQRRRVTNLRNIATAIQKHYGTAMQVRHLGTDSLTLKQQILQYVEANVLVLGHGAGMLHVLWMRPHSHIVEIIPHTQQNDINGAVQGCKRLCKILGFRLERVMTREAHDEASVGDVLACLPTKRSLRCSRTRSLRSRAQKRCHTRKPSTRIKR